MNIHDVVEPRDIFFQQHWEEYYFFRKKKTHSLAPSTPNFFYPSVCAAMFVKKS
jgi:hypothetical protein